MTTDDDVSSSSSPEEEEIAAKTTTTTTLWLLFVFYLVQPLVMWKMIAIRRSYYLPLQVVRASVAVWYFATVYAFAWRLHELLPGDHYDPNINFLWWPFAHLGFKYLHAVADGSPKFERSLGLVSFRRVVAFCYSPATLIFLDKNKSNEHAPDDGNKKKDLSIQRALNANKKNRPWKLVLRGLIQAALVMLLIHLIVKHDLERRVPYSWMNSTVLFYIVALSFGAIADIAFNAPAQLLADSSGLLFGGSTKTGTDVVVVVVIYVADVPAATTNARFIWHRWSKNLGFHLRKSIYDRILILVGGGGGKKKNSCSTNVWLATFCTFAANCILHVAWYGPLAVGRRPVAWEYVHLLVFAPMIALAADQLLRLVVVVAAGTRHHSNLLYSVGSFLVLQAMIAAYTKQFLLAQGMPQTMTEFALANNNAR